MDDHFIDPETRDMLIKLMSHKNERPTHMLFYGPPDVGKARLARNPALVSILAPINGAPLTSGRLQCLESLEASTPGDFKIAADLFRWKPPGLVDNLELMEALKNESAGRNESPLTPAMPNIAAN
jgi:hypothetical protein